MSTLFLKIFTLVILALMLTSCSKEALLTSKGPRNLDMVKVGAPEQRTERRSSTVEEKSFGTVTIVEENGENDSSEAVLAAEERSSTGHSDRIERLAEIVMGITGFESNARTVGKALPDIKSGIASPVKKAEKLLLKDRLSVKESNKPSVNLVRLLIYLLIAVLIIMILDLILPGRLVTLIVLVVLLLLLLYLLGGL